MSGCRYLLPECHQLLSGQYSKGGEGLGMHAMDPSHWMCNVLEVGRSCVSSGGAPTPAGNINVPYAHT